MKQSYRIRPYLAVVALICLFLTVMAFSLLLVSREANRLESNNSKNAVARSISAQIDQVVATANDNSVWDDAARALYSDNGNQTFFWNAWGIASAEGKKFETIAVIDHAGRVLIHYRKGRTVRGDLDLHFGKSLDVLISKSDDNKAPAGGIVSTNYGLMYVAAAPMLPASAALDSLIPANGAFHLIIAKPIDESVLSTISGHLLVKNLTLSAKKTNQVSIDIRDPIGRKVAELSWTPSNTGSAGLMQAMPLIVFVAFIHILFALIFVMRAYKSVKQLENEALVDSLSKLPNRRALRGELDVRLIQGEKIALGLIDLDGFKTINDSYGHAVGDRLIIAVSKMLTDLCGTSCVVARLGGDEFAILATGSGCVGKIELIAQKILLRMAHPFRVDERTVVVGASIGLASVSLHDYDALELMRRADVAMYAAKRAGKMRVQWYDEMLDQKQIIARTIEAELRQAIDAESFEIVYQPIVCAITQRIVGVEALLRWASPTYGEIGPAEFIPVAEETGLIDRIGMIALRRVCLDGLAWSDIDVSINISASQMRNPDFVKNLSLVLAETGFPSNRLVLEITENSLLYDQDISFRTISAIKDLGARIAIDDYGTGQTAIMFLHKFGIDKIKADNSMIMDASNHEGSLVVLNTVTTIARSLGIATCAEGIETREQAELMKVIGFEQLQGWLFSRAVSATTVSELLVQKRVLSKKARKLAAN